MVLKSVSVELVELMSRVGIPENDHGSNFMSQLLAELDLLDAWGTPDPDQPVPHPDKWIGGASGYLVA